MSEALSPGLDWPRHLKLLIAAFQQLAREGWGAQSANELRSASSAIASLADEQGMTRIRERASEISLFLDSFMASGRRPDGEQMAVLEALISTLGSVLMAVAQDPNLGRAQPLQATRSVPYEWQRVLLLRMDESFAADLPFSLESYGLLVERFASPSLLLPRLDQIRPGALIIDARFLSAIRAVNRRLDLHANAENDRVARVVLSDTSDLSRRLLAMSAQADAYFATPISVATVAARIDELIVHRDREPYRILIVDDDRSQAKYCDIILRQRGMVTEVAPTALKALEFLKQRTPDLILLDLAMPDISGLELTAIIRERPDLHQVPIVFLSGTDDTHVQFDAISLGGDDFLAKPIRPRHLLSAVASRARRARRMRQHSVTRQQSLIEAWPRLPERARIAPPEVPAPPAVEPSSAAAVTPAISQTRTTAGVVVVEAPLPPATLFQAIVPIHGRLTHQYALTLAKVEREDWLSAPLIADWLGQFGAQIARQRFLLTQALNTRVEQLKKGRQLRLFVGFSASGLIEPSFLPWLKAELSARKLSGSGLILSIEHSELEPALTQRHELGRIGIQLAVRGFDPKRNHQLGRGSELSYVKIDRRLLGPDHAADFRTVVNQARTMARAVIVEDVPHLGVLSRVIDAGVDYVQTDLVHAYSANPDHDFSVRLM